MDIKMSNKSHLYKIYYEVYGGFFTRKLAEGIDLIRATSIEKAYRKAEKEIEKLNKTRNCPITIKEIELIKE